MSKKQQNINPEKQTKAIKQTKQPKSADKRFIFEKIEKLPIAIVALIVAGIAIVIYIKILNFDLIQFDDDGFIRKYTALVASGNAFSKVFTDTFGASFFRPILSLSLLVDAQNWGTTITGWYLSNLLIHLAGSVLLFFCLYKMKFTKTLSMLFSILFAVHPLLTPSVAWISGRNDSLLAVFSLASFLTLLYATEKKGQLNYPFAIINIIFLIISLFTKESAVVLPVIFWLYLWLCRGTKIITPVTLTLAGGWAIAIVIFLLARAGSPVYYTKYDIYGLQALFLNFPALIAITGKIFLPIKMSGCSQYDSLSLISGGIFTAALIAAPLFFRDKVNIRAYYFGLIWFYLALMPTLTVKVHITSYDYLEHRAYLPLAGIMMSLLTLITGLGLNLNSKAVKYTVYAILMLFGFRNLAYSSSFSGPENFWQNNINQYPDNFQGYLSLGRYYFKLDSFALVDKYYSKAYQYGADRYDVLQALAARAVIKPDYKAAENLSRRSLALNEQNAYAYASLSAALYGLGRYDEAIAAAKTGIIHDGDKKVPDLWFNMGLTYFFQKKYKESIRAYENGLKQQPNYARGYANIGASYFSLGDVANAIKYFYIALEKNPMLPEANNNLIKLLADKEPKRAAEIARNYTSRGGKLEDAVTKMLAK